jgi:hypothetical protein
VTDIFCFTCDHEIKPELLTGRLVHLHEAEAEGCVCTEIGEECQPL